MPAMSPRRVQFDREQILSKVRIRIDEAAFLLECHVDTVRRWLDAGKLKYRRTPGGERRVYTESVKEYL